MNALILKIHAKAFPVGKENKRKRLISICLVCGFVANLIGQCSQLLIGNYETLPFNLVFFAFYITCFVVNYLGNTVLAGLLISYGCAFIIIFSSVIWGFERHLLIFFIPLIIANYFLIDFKDSKLVLLQMLFPFMYILSDNFFDLRVYQISHVSLQAQKFEQIVSTTLSMAMSSIFVYYIIIEAYKSENYIRESLVKVSLQNDELLKRNDEIDRFVYSVSHELRAPVATMRGLQLVIDEEPNIVEIRKYLLMQEKCLLRLDDYIKDVLNYYATNRLSLLIEKIDFSQLLAENLEKFEFLITSHGIVVESNIQLVNIFYSDSYRINMILSNILSNAVKYYDIQKPMKTITILVRGNDTSVVLKIKDNGIGISDAELPSIFTMFHKSEITSASSGLGMYIVKESTEKMEGTVAINSERNRYTEVTVRLPNLKKYHLLDCK